MGTELSGPEGPMGTKLPLNQRKHWTRGIFYENDPTEPEGPMEIELPGSEEPMRTELPLNQRKHYDASLNFLKNIFANCCR